MRGGDADAPIAGGACGAVAGGRKMMWGGAIAGGSVAGGSVAADSAPADVEGGKRSKRSLGTKMKAHLAMTRERAMRIKAEHPSWPGNRVWREAMIMGRRSRSRR
jgi:chorismate-pyruvate lyase